MWLLHVRRLALPAPPLQLSASHASQDTISQVHHVYHVQQLSSIAHNAPTLPSVLYVKMVPMALLVPLVLILNINLVGFVISVRLLLLIVKAVLVLILALYAKILLHCIRLRIVHVEVRSIIRGLHVLLVLLQSAIARLVQMLILVPLVRLPSPYYQLLTVVAARQHSSTLPPLNANLAHK